MLGKRAALVVILIVAWLAQVPSLHAETETALLVVGGNAADHDRATVSSALETAIRMAGWTLRAKPLNRKDADGLLKCTDSKSPWTCIPVSFKTTGGQGAFVALIDLIQGDKGAPTVHITVKMIVTNPPAFSVRERFCEGCADDKLIEAGQDVVQQLTHELAKRSGRTVVVIKSIPSSGSLIFDGERLGGTDATFNTFPGKHTAMVEKPGYNSEIREFNVEEGKTAEVTLTLHASPIDPAPTPAASAPTSHVAAYVAIGAGSALTVFGGISLYEGQRNIAKFDYT